MSSPSAFPRRVSSRSRLHLPLHPNELPIPPRLVGSPLLEKLNHPDPAALTPKIQKQLWFDGDEFGTRRSAHEDSAPSPLPSPSTISHSPGTPRSASSRRSHRRSPSIVIAHRARSHSPPPPQQFPPSIPPVPPIPSSVFDTPGTKRAVLRTPPTTPSPWPRAHIVIPDLDDSPSGFPSSALRFSPRSRSSASPRRRVGSESH